MPRQLSHYVQRFVCLKRTTACPDLTDHTTKVVTSQEYSRSSGYYLGSSVNWDVSRYTPGKGSAKVHKDCRPDTAQDMVHLYAQ